MSRVTPTKALAHLDRLAAWQAGGRAAPVTVEWDLSNRCTLGCMDCHFAHTHVRGPWATKSRMLPMAYDSGGDLADTQLVKRGLREMAQGGVQGVVWSGGGEPTTHPQWREIVAYAASQGLRQGMYTLGGLLTERGLLAQEGKMGYPMQYRGDLTVARHLDWVVVSLDCHDAATYAAEKGVKPERFEEACDGIRSTAMVAERKAVVGVSFLLHGKNWHRAARMRSLAKDLGADYVTFRPAIRTSPDRPSECDDDRAWILGAMDTLEWLAEDPFVEVDPQRFAAYWNWRGHGYDECHGIKLNATVTPDGRLWVCPQRRGIPGSCFGDLRVESFGEAWARHPGKWTDFSGCRVMCRLHGVNQQLAPAFVRHEHEAFV